MRFSRTWFIFFSVTTWLFMARADQGKLTQDFFNDAELYSKLEMIEEFTVLENISDKDIKMAQSKDPQEVQKTEQTP